VPFVRPTLTELVARVRGDLRGRLEIDGPLLRRAMADVLGAVWAGGLHEQHGFLDFESRQLFGLTAERDQLLLLAALYGIVPIAATYAVGNVTALGTDGSSIPAGTIIRLDAATSYRVTTGQVIASGTATVPVQAVLAGDEANVPAGTVLTFETPITGVNSSVTVATGDLTGGDDGDSGDAGTERVRTRYLLRLREPPAGGRDADYVAFALTVAGVTRVWTFPNENGLGTVVVRFVRDNDVTIFPDAGEVAAVQAVENAERPITAVVTVVAPTQLTVAFTIHVVPDNADTRSAVTAELIDLFTRVAAPGNGAGMGTVLLSAIRTAIGIAEGVTDYLVTVPAADVVPGVGQLPVVGTITFV
jgi:uncharacterized phage protein gp47/JayE